MTTNPEPDPFGAVILSGGTGRRLGLIDKSALIVGGRTLLERAIGSVLGAEQIVVVGPAPAAALALPTGGPSIRFTLEDPVGGGPAAGLLAGRDAMA